MSVEIRELRSEDLSAVTEIYTDAVLHGTASYELTPPDLGEMSSRYSTLKDMGYPYLAAVDGSGQLLGYAYGSAFRSRPAYRWLVEDSIYVHSSARGRGVGKALLVRLLDQCEALGFRQMVAVIGGASEVSMAMHRSCGFDLAGRLNATGFKHGSWLDTVFMQKALGEGATTLPDLSSYPGTMG